MKIEDLLITRIKISDEALANCLAKVAAQIPNVSVGSMQVSCGDATVWLYRLSEADCWLEEEDIEKLTLVLGGEPKFFIQTQHNLTGNSDELARQVQRELNDVCPVAFQFYDGRIGTLNRED